MLDFDEKMTALKSAVAPVVTSEKISSKFAFEFDEDQLEILELLINQMKQKSSPPFIPLSAYLNIIKKENPEKVADVMDLVLSFYNFFKSQRQVKTFDYFFKKSPQTLDQQKEIIDVLESFANGARKIVSERSPIDFSQEECAIAEMHFEKAQTKLKEAEDEMNSLNEKLKELGAFKKTLSQLDQQEKLDDRTYEKLTDLMDDILNKLESYESYKDDLIGENIGSINKQVKNLTKAGREALGKKAEQLETYRSDTVKLRKKDYNQHIPEPIEPLSNDPEIIAEYERELSDYQDKLSTYHSFLKMGDKMYIMQRGEDLGKGGFGKVKMIQEIIINPAASPEKRYEGGEIHAVKIERKKEKRGKDIEDVDHEEEILKELGMLHGKMDRQSKSIKDPESEGPYKKYSVMTFIPGENLAIAIDRKRLTKKDRYLIALKSCLTVQKLHQKNQVVHGDIKPQNFIYNAKAKGKKDLSAIDFGLSRKLEEGVEKIQPKRVGFTPGYGAPEVMMKGIFSYATDVYALGIMLKNDLEIPIEDFGFSATDLDFDELQKEIMKDPQRDQRDQNLDKIMKRRPSLDKVIKKLADTLLEKAEALKLSDEEREFVKGAKKPIIEKRPPPITPDFRAIQAATSPITPQSPTIPSSPEASPSASSPEPSSPASSPEPSSPVSSPEPSELPPPKSPKA